MLETIYIMLAVTVPSILIFAMGYIFIKKMFDSERRRLDYDKFKQTTDKIKPLKIRGYERLILFLSRMEYESLIKRCMKPGMTSSQLANSMINEINLEFQHNISQQLFVTDQAWEYVKASKKSMENLINTIISSINKDSNAEFFSSILSETYENNDNKPIEIASKYLRDEFNAVF